MPFRTGPHNPLKRNARQIAARLRFRHGGNARLRKRASAAMKTLGGGVVYGTLVEPALVQTTQVEINVADLPPVLDGYRIAHLTDIHYNFAAGKSFLHRIVQKTNALDPDMVALTGDFITHKPENLERCFSILSDLRAPDGCWVVRGNHDYRVPLEQMKAACRHAGFRFLENDHVTVRPSRQRVTAGNRLEVGVLDGFTLAGVGDLWEGECLPGKALSGANAGRPAILLSHQAEAAELLTGDHRVDLVLSGHTHGGQVRALNREIPFFSSGSRKYVSGLVYTPRTRVYISRGVGTSALRFRWNCRPEIALIHLHPDHPAASF